MRSRGKLKPRLTVLHSRHANSGRTEARIRSADRLEEASAVLDQIEPLSDEPWLAVVHSVPEVDEPVRAFIRERSRAFDAARGKAQDQRAG